MRVKVIAPHGHTGTVCGVTFVDGVALVDEAEHRAAVGYFRRRDGYDVQTVEEAQIDESPAADDPGAGVDPPSKAPLARNASKADWKAYAVEHGGMTEADAETATRDQLAETYLGPKEA